MSRVALIELFLCRGSKGYIVMAGPAGHYHRISGVVRLKADALKCLRRLRRELQFDPELKQAFLKISRRLTDSPPPPAAG